MPDTLRDWTDLTAWLTRVDEVLADHDTTTADARTHLEDQA